MNTALHWYRAHLYSVILDGTNRLSNILHFGALFLTLWTLLPDYANGGKTSSVATFHHTKQQHRGLIEISIQYAPLTEPLLYLVKRLELPEVGLATFTKRCFVYARCGCVALYVVHVALWAASKYTGSKADYFPNIQFEILYNSTMKCSFWINHW